MEKRIRKENKWSDYLYKKVEHSKICHQSLGVRKKKSDARSEHGAGQPLSGGVRLLNV